MFVSRREFCQTALAGTASMFMAAGCSTFCSACRKPGVAVQLYSVRGLCQRDLPGTLKALKAMGYEGVEFAGYYGKSAKEMKQLLDDNGLVAAGTHINANDLVPGKIEALFDYAEGVGNKYIVCPGGGFKQGSRNDLMEMAARFSKAAELAKPHGIRIGYHNHGNEFRRLFDGKCAWEIFFDACSKDVFTQLDIGHAHVAGEDPLFWINRFPGRSVTVHVKENYKASPSGILGQNPAAGVPWAKVWPALKANGCEWYVVECESNAGSLAGVEGCIRYMKSVGEA
ncbi:MAG: sugar phosphate isomerase/epimerase [Kiritimatiellae bacterium]|nr:sugar phosphate isomerase/epimerase [Kiritimatiellia bacterium]